MSEHKYKVAYKTIPLGEGKTKAEMQADPELEGYGGTDQFILVSTLLPESGGRSVHWDSSDAEGNPLPEKDIYGAMMIIVRNLALNGELDEFREKMCWAIWNGELIARGQPAQDLDDVRQKFGPREFDA